MKASLLIIFLLTIASLRGKGQLCNGSSGDPVVNITFGNTKGRLPSNTTTFEYANGCPSKGQYTISNLLFGCGDNRSWLALAGDHTMDVNGQFMMVNAQGFDIMDTTGIIHTDTARGLCSNVSYVYSAWITNMLRGFSCGGAAARANLTLTVATLTGTVLGTAETGELPVEEDKHWKEYGVRFQVPAGVDAVVMQVSAHRKPGCGQGFAIDDIMLKACGPEVDVTVNGSADPLKVCADFTKPFVFKGTYAAGFSNPAVQWQRSLDTGKTWIDILPATSSDFVVPQNDTGMILYRMAVAEKANIGSPNCRIYSNVLSTTVSPLIPHQAPQKLLGCTDKDLFLPRSDPFADRVLWTGPNNYSSTLEKSVVPHIGYADTGLYQLKQTFSSGCVALDSFYVNVSPSATVTVPTEYGICEGRSVVLSASGSGVFNWQPATGLSNTGVANPVASPHDSTQYKVVLTNSYGCKDSALVMVNVFRNPVVNAGENKTIVRGDTVTLDGLVKGTAVNYSWSPAAFINDNSLSSPIVYPPSDMQYTLTAQSAVGCGTVTSSVTVKVYNDVYVPNAFSPNGDGRNERFRIVAADGYQVLKWQVFNRWGQVVYEAKDFSRGWDGTYHKTPQPEGSYVYYLQIRSAEGKVISKQGTVTLIR